MFEKQIDIFRHLLDPWQFMAFAATYLPLTLFNLVVNSQFLVLLSPSALRDAWFARFWSTAGPGSRKNAIPRVGPLICEARGVVLDIGPGGGEWLNLYDRKKVTKIYGVEPNRDHHELLKRRIKEADLSDIFHIVPVGVEDLGERWVGMGEVDTVVTLQCLCSVERPREMINSLYRYLKEGGRWIVYEHVITQQVGFIKAYQAFVDIFWPYFLGGCSITRDTEKYLRESGSWNTIDLKQPELEPSYQVIPHLIGVLTK